MERTLDYLWQRWDDAGVLEDLPTIEEALDGVISFEEHSNIPEAVKWFMGLVRPEEGMILFGKTKMNLLA